ncbi:mariner Mos1 transposase [Trichonephila clavipes]|nr:mariner Mos1 transposase [Trichonephila clavipes]
MSNFMPSDDDLRKALTFCYHLKKNAAESHQMHVEAYSAWQTSKKFEDAELQALLDEDDDKTQEHLREQLNADQSTVSRRLKAMGRIIKFSRWGPQELTDRQQENRKIVCEMWLARYKRKSYLHRIVTGDEKWIYFGKPKRNRSYVNPGQPPKSTARLNRFGRKTMLCIFWDKEEPIYYELLKPGETGNTDRYKQQLLNLNDAILEKREQYKKQQHKVIFHDDNAPSIRAINRPRTSLRRSSGSP